MRTAPRRPATRPAIRQRRTPPSRGGDRPGGDADGQRGLRRRRRPDCLRLPGAGPGPDPPPPAGRAQHDRRDDKDAQVCRLPQRAHTLRSEELPDDCRQALGHLRRTARLVNDLLERLAETRTVRKSHEPPPLPLLFASSSEGVLVNDH
ncbi:hypothetical protein [Streptomyces sp. NBC_00838]|uniref:hypothetical protein n=1 Tax=Streptomyces sp. NBC_00838 TaxID=2903680 RepID=UPI00386C6281